MINFIKRNPIKSIVLTLIIFSILIRSANKEVGFCFEQGRIIPDKEMIEMLLDYRYKNDIKLDSADTSAKVYLANHPDCCHVYNRSILKNLFNTTFEDIEISYPIRENTYHYQAGSRENTVVFSVDQCGKVFEVFSLPE